MKIPAIVSTRRSLSLLLLALAASGCEKDRGMPAAKGSGALSASEAELLVFDLA